MFQVQVLGTSSAIPTNNRRLSAQVVTINDRHHLVDCGEGTQMQLLRYKVRVARLDAIFISHLHGDHILGLPGLLNSLNMYERNFPLRLYGPANLKEMLDAIFRLTYSYMGYELEFIPTEDFQPGDVLYETKTHQVELLPLDHRIYCRGFRFVEHNKKPRFDFYKAKSLEIPNEYFSLLKQGNTITLPNGKQFLPEQVLLPPATALSYAYCSDTCYYEELIPFIKDTHLLYHEATFLDDLKNRAAETAHSTAREAATIAQKAGVGHLLLGHYSARYKDLTPLEEEAKQVFPESELAFDGRVYKVKDYV